jgi:hypothetical protein
MQPQFAKSQGKDHLGGILLGLKRNQIWLDRHSQCGWIFEEAACQGHLAAEEGNVMIFFSA